MQEADLIFAGPLESTNEAMVWKLSVATTVKGKLSVATTVKGKPAATVTVSLASCNKDRPGADPTDAQGQPGERPRVR